MIKQGNRYCVKNSWDHWYGFENGKQVQSFGPNEFAAMAWLKEVPSADSFIHPDFLKPEDAVGEYRRLYTLHFAPSLDHSSLHGTN